MSFQLWAGNQKETEKQHRNFSTLQWQIGVFNFWKPMNEYVAVRNKKAEQNDDKASVSLPAFHLTS